MEQPARDSSGLKTFADDPVFLLSKLAWEIGEVVKPENQEAAVRIFTSVNAAATAWHIHEWLWKLATDEVRARLVNAFSLEKANEKCFGVACQRASPDIRICRQITIAGKHVNGDKYDDATVFPQVYAKDGDLENCHVVLNSKGQELSDVEVYQRALEWWIDLYVEQGYSRAAEIASMLEMLDRPR